MTPTLPQPNLSPNMDVEDSGCFDCHKVECTYMLKDEVWAEAWPTYAKDQEEREFEIRSTHRSGAPDEMLWRLETHGRLFLCFACLETRLGRALVLEDFSPMEEAPCNRAVFLGARIEKLA